MAKNDHSPPSDADVTVTGHWLTAYGERFPCLTEARGMFLTPEYMMSMAGIHDPDARRICMAALDSLGRPSPAHRGMVRYGRFDLFRTLLSHGGRRPPVVGLPLPRVPLGGLSAIGGLDGKNAYWVRHDEMLRFIHDNLDVHFGRDPDRLIRVITRQLEHWTEGTIFCLPQAVAYALTAHPEWRRAAATWLLPHTDSWLRDYKHREPHVGVLARLAAKRVPVPGWLRSHGA